MITDKPKAPCELRRGQWRDRRIKLRLAIYMLLPIDLRATCISRLLVRHHRVRVIEHGRSSLEPVGSRLLAQTNQPAITCGQVYSQARRVIGSRSVVLRSPPGNWIYISTVGVNERLQPGKVGTPVLLIINLNADAETVSCLCRVSSELCGVGCQGCVPILRIGDAAD